jgi:PAS domain S-box-containing protein
MSEKPWSVTGEQALDIVSLCRYFSELSPQPMVAVEGETHIVRHINAAFSCLVGKKAAELIGRPFAEAVPEGEDNGCLPLLDRVYRTGTPEILVEQEHRHTTPAVYWSYSVWAILGAEERPVGVIIQVTDATETTVFRSEAVAMNEQLLLSATRQHELTESAERADHLKDESLTTLSREIAERKAAEESIRFQAHLLDTVEQSVIATDLDGIVIYWNQFAQKLYGWTAQEATGRQIIELTTPEIMAEQALEIMSQLRQGKSWAGEFKVQRRDGTTFPAQIFNSPISDPQGKLIGIIGVSTDISERKRAEAALRDAQERLLQAMDAAKMFSWEMKPETQEFSFSSNVERTMGFTFPKDIINNPIGNRLHPEDVEQAVRKTLHAIETGEPYEDTMRMVNPHTGEIVWIHSQGILAKNAEGEQRFVGIAQNITERKRQEDSLMELTRQLERQSNVFNTTLSAITDFAYIFDRDGRFLYANQPLLDLWGLKLDEAVGKNFFDLQYPDDLALRLQQQIQQVIDTGQGLRDETPYTSPTGAEGFYEYIFTPVKASDGTVEVVAGSTRDYTERKRAEKELNASEERLRTIFEASRDGILVEDDERIVYVNQSYTHLFGYEAPEELIGKHVSSVISSEDTERLLKFGESRVRGKLPASVYEFKGKRKDGTLIEVEASVSASSVTSHSYITSIVRDITERKRAQAELKQINEQLEGRVTERTAALSEMNAILQEEVRERRRIEGERVELLRRIVFAQEDERRRIAREMHDQFGQQLTVLKMKLDAVKEDCSENENLCEQVEALQRIARQLDADVDHMVWEMRPTALDDLGLQAALSSYVQNWSKHFGIPVQLHASGMDKERLTPEIETTLYRIAQEALNNVAKHAEAKSAAVMLERRATQVSLIIEDDGVGFDLQQILDANDKGLGLVGLRERAALVGGTVEIESQPDEGTTVVVRIPTPPVPETGKTND